ncbi:hypothetical protein AWN76_002590 [Rhodothermaceae bacterium RA]|nr:hypothetical protein AWN76_002590 [Rhodothermaceae bacterium RA]
MLSLSLIYLLLGLVLFVLPVHAQIEISTDGNVNVGSANHDAYRKLHIRYDKPSGTTKVVAAEYSGTQAYDAVAVYGRSEPAPFWGIGGKFIGGFAGIDTYATMSGSGNRVGYYGRASGGTGSNYGTYTWAEGNSGTKYGVFGMARGDAGTKYGVYGWAYGSGTNYAGYFSGNVHITGTLTNPSDERLKTNVRALQGRDVLAKLRAMRPVAFRYKEQAGLNAVGFQALELPEGERVGFVAQEVAQVFPDLVHEQVHVVPEDPEAEKVAREATTVRYQSVDYLAMIPLLVRAIQEQQEEIDALRVVLEQNGLDVSALGDRR